MQFLAGLIAALMLAAPAVAQPVQTGHLTAELVADHAAIAPGQTIHVALRQDIQKGWHTYWRNSGDSGEATKIAWTLPAGWKAGDFTWPTPHRLPVGPLMNYGYTGQVLLPMTLTAPADARPGAAVTLKAQAGFLVCADLCVPEDATLTLTLPVAAPPTATDAQWAGPIADALAAAPKPAGLAAAFQPAEGGVALAITGPALKGADVAGAYFYPYDSTLLDHAKPQAIERGPDGLTLTLGAGYGFQQGRAPKTLAGVLALADGRAFEIAATPAPPPPAARGLGAAPAASLKPPATGLKAIFSGAASDGAVTPARIPGGDLGLLAACAFALLGGLILNLMPCVFPILAMKAASLAAHGGAGVRQARREGLAFGLGVLVAFGVLAGVLIALKAGGAAIGWGFQLQSAPVVAVLALLMLAVALNLSGVFEVGASLQGAGAGLASRSGVAGAFFTGALAVVVAAPCTAPFMGAALGWALTQSAPAALAVFLALGIGFAAPFVAIACLPALVRRLPRPGGWMDIFRKALAFPMYAAAGWLAWVLAQQAGAAGLAQLIAAAVVVALAAWLWGLAQQGARGGVVLRLAAVTLAVLALAGAAWPQPADPVAAASAGPLAHEAYSPAKLAGLRAQGRPVFVNYTAAWCVSCQVNDRVALSSAPVAAAIARDNVAYLKADWTNRNAEIAAELSSHGRAGVPLYLVYGTDGGAPAILPSILTPGIVVRALDRAAGRP